MRLELSMVEVEGSIFISGTNLGPKIDQTHKGGCRLFYDTDLRLDVIVHKGKVALVNGKSRIIANPLDVGVDLTPVPQPKRPESKEVTYDRIKAQVSGPGQGLRLNAQVETPIDKVQGTPGRKAKYQGEAN